MARGGQANGARSLCQPDGSGRSRRRAAAPAVMAAMVEGVNRRKTKRGADFVRRRFLRQLGPVLRLVL